MKKSILSFTHKMELYEFLKDCLTIVGDPNERKVRYLKEWSDETVAAAQPFPCTMTNVGSTRKECFGELASARKYTGSSATSERLEHIEKVLANLVLIVNSLSEKKITSDI